MIDSWKFTSATLVMVTAVVWAKTMRAAHDPQDWPFLAFIAVVGGLMILLCPRVRF